MVLQQLDTLARYVYPIWERLSANSEDHTIASRKGYTAMVVVLLLLLLPATSLTGYYNKTWPSLGSGVSSTPVKTRKLFL